MSWYGSILQLTFHLTMDFIVLINISILRSKYCCREEGEAGRLPSVKCAMMRLLLVIICYNYHFTPPPPFPPTSLNDFCVEALHYQSLIMIWYMRYYWSNNTAVPGDVKTNSCQCLEAGMLLSRAESTEHTIQLTFDYSLTLSSTDKPKARKYLTLITILASCKKYGPVPSSS